MARVQRLQRRDIPQAMRAALQPEHWKAVARQTAVDTLNAMVDLSAAETPNANCQTASANLRQYVEGFVNTLMVGPFGAGFFFADEHTVSRGAVAGGLSGGARDDFTDGPRDGVVSKGCFAIRGADGGMGADGKAQG